MRETCVIIGGGWAGCAAAIGAAKMGSSVVLVEKTDLLIGLGNVGGIMRNNGRYTAAEENICMGAKELFQITDECSVHKDLDFPGHAHSWLYDPVKVEPKTGKLLRQLGVTLLMESRAVDVEMKGEGLIKAVILADGRRLEGKAFVDATGTAGPMGNCAREGTGCSMCILRCPSFGPRVSISQRAGATDMVARRRSGRFGAFSGSCKLVRRSLGKELQQELAGKGVAVVNLPQDLVRKEKLEMKVCSQYALDSFAENLVLLDAGGVKMMTPYFNLQELRKIPGFEGARFEDPYGGTKGNSIRYMAVAPRNEKLKVEGVENLFCAGEKSGFFVGHTEAITTGSLAGYNCARYGRGKEEMTLPRELAVGELIARGQEVISQKDGFQRRLTFAGGEFFERMKEKGLYSTSKKEIERKVYGAGLTNIYNQP